MKISHQIGKQSNKGIQEITPWEFNIFSNSQIFLPTGQAGKSSNLDAAI